MLNFNELSQLMSWIGSNINIAHDILDKEERERNHVADSYMQLKDALRIKLQEARKLLDNAVEECEDQMQQMNIQSHASKLEEYEEKFAQMPDIEKIAEDEEEDEE